ncbi:hypothetical protein ABIB54_003385 [Frigoribacterium sp. UYMn621]
MVGMFWLADQRSFDSISFFLGTSVKPRPTRQPPQECQRASLDESAHPLAFQSWKPPPRPAGFGPGAGYFPDEVPLRAPLQAEKHAQFDFRWGCQIQPGKGPAYGHRQKVRPRAGWGYPAIVQRMALTGGTTCRRVSCPVPRGASRARIVFAVLVLSTDVLTDVLVPHALNHLRWMNVQYYRGGSNGRCPSENGPKYSTYLESTQMVTAGQGHHSGLNLA